MWLYVAMSAQALHLNKKVWSERRRCLWGFFCKNRNYINLYSWFAHITDYTEANPPSFIKRVEKGSTLITQPPVSRETAQAVFGLFPNVRVWTRWKVFALRLAVATPWTSSFRVNSLITNFVNNHLVFVPNLWRKDRCPQDLLTGNTSSAWGRIHTLKSLTRHSSNTPESVRQNNVMPSVSPIVRRSEKYGHRKSGGGWGHVFPPSKNNFK